MTTKLVPPALEPQAILAKSKLYISRALAAKARQDMGEYQLWASLALEFLGKSALAQIHPCLVADPQSFVSLFAAAGVNIGSDVKTIPAKTVFERLTHVSKRFDNRTQDFCDNMSLKRNAELHSGEAAFEAAIPASWEGRFWHTADIILEITEQRIEHWLGADHAEAPKELLAEYTYALSEAAKVRVDTARDAFRRLPMKERDARKGRADQLAIWEVRRGFRLLEDGIWPVICPACGSRSFVAGVKYAEEVSDQDDGYSEEETVDIMLSASEFHCPSCDLQLDSRDEIEAVGLVTDWTETETRQREYEPDYGND